MTDNDAGWSRESGRSSVLLDFRGGGARRGADGTSSKGSKMREMQLTHPRKQWNQSMMNFLFGILHKGVGLWESHGFSKQLEPVQVLSRVAADSPAAQGGSEAPSLSSWQQSKTGGAHLWGSRQNGRHPTPKTSIIQHHPTSSQP